ncbi:hypothetical protein Glove_423g65 [Diversispora epigaea]|uniref:G-protein coupled receptors family 1 profile domain-containing protein n=1 Tax=Diversispora epigaea TaxID=1348612 RepID=A0A397H0G6_9GLOM|nr:hypothetical protein Glove_423g65 [Diversispora epigaea]
MIALSTLVRNSSCQDSTSIQNVNTTTTTNNNVIIANETDIYDTPGFLLVYATSYTFMSFNTIGIIYMLVQIYIRWSYTKGALSMAIKVPLYLGILDAMLLITSSTVFIYPMIHHSQWKEPYCRILAGVSIAVTILKRNMVVIIAIVTYLRVCKEVYWNYGKFDWKLWAIAGFMTVVLSFMGVKGYGANKYWCSTKASTMSVSLISLLLSLIVVLVCIFCYSSIILAVRAIRINKIKAAGNNIDTETSTISNISMPSEIEVRAIKKISSYILVYIIQWFPSIPRNVDQMLGFMTVVLSFMGVKGYGANKYWCSTKASTMSVSLISLLLSLIVVLVCIFCYSSIILAVRAIRINKIKAAGNNIDTETSTISNISMPSEIEVRAIKKISSYILVYIIQWFPSIPRNVDQMLGNGTAWTFALVIAAMNMGGIGNAIFYFINERKYITDNLDTSSSGIRLSTNAKQMGGGKGSEEETDEFDSINVIPLQEYSTASLSINNNRNSK